MKLSDVVSHSGLSGYAEIALVIFLVVFAAVVVKTFWPGGRDRLRHVSRLPLEDADEGHPEKEVKS
jgi:cbb3-type cytochrome oxidase subunit 3